MIKNFEDFVTTQNVQTVEEGLLDIFKKDTLKGRLDKEFREYSKNLKEIEKISKAIMEMAKTIWECEYSTKMSNAFVILKSELNKEPFILDRLNIKSIGEVIEDGNEDDIDSFKEFLENRLERCIMPSTDDGRLVTAEQFKVGLVFSKEYTEHKEIIRHIKEKMEDDKDKDIFKIENVNNYCINVNIFNKDETKRLDGDFVIIWFEDFKKAMKFFK